MECCCSWMDSEVAQIKSGQPWLRMASVFVKFDKIRSFWVIWGIGREYVGFRFLLETQRRRARGAFIEKGTLVSGAKANEGA